MNQWTGGGKARPAREEAGDAVESEPNRRNAKTGEQRAPAARARTPRRRDADSRRRLLVAAAIRVIAAHGAAAATVGRISAEAGVSRGLISHHFAGKDDLLLAVYRQLTEELAAETARIAQARGSDTEAKLRAAIEAAFRPPVFAPDKIAVWLGFWGEARTRPRLGDLNRALYRNYRATLARLAAEAARARGVTLDAHRAALALTALIDGLWLEWALDPEAFSEDEALGVCLDLLDRLLAGAPSPAKNETADVP